MPAGHLTVPAFHVLLDSMHAAMKHVGMLAGLFNSMLLDGVASPELTQHGYTTDEERGASGLSQARPLASSSTSHSHYAVMALSHPDGHA